MDYYQFFYSPTIHMIHIYKGKSVHGIVPIGLEDLSDEEINEKVEEYCKSHGITRYQVYRAIKEDWS